MKEEYKRSLWYRDGGWCLVRSGLGIPLGEDKRRKRKQNSLVISSLSEVVGSGGRGMEMVYIHPAMSLSFS